MKYASLKDFRYVEDVVQKSGSSFALGMKALPEGRRGYLFAIYAYCRVLDDIADCDLPTESKLQELKNWRQKVNELIAGNPTCEITRVLADAIEVHQIPTDELYLVIDGMEADANGPIMKPTWEELMTYCRQVAVSVGLLSLPVFGRHDDEARAFGVELGYALQLTNILRDICEDDENGRLYLPEESLEAHNVSDIFSPNLCHVLAEVAEKTQHHYEAAHKLLQQCGTDHLKPAMMMMVVYEKLFEKMKRRGWHQISPRIRLSTMEKMMEVAKVMATA